MEMFELIAKPASEAQKLAAWSNACSQWGLGLSLSGYIEREKRLESRPLTSDNITLWVLVPKENTESLELFSQLDAITRPAYFKSDNTIETKSVVAITSVLTPHKYRGRGFASQLLRKLHEQLEQTEVFGGVLYSDVGTFYEKFNYSLCSPHHVILPPKNNPHTVTTLNESDISELAEKDCKLIKQEMLEDPDRSLVITPHAASYDWIFERSKIYASSLGKESPSIFGAEHKDEFLVWTYDYPKKKLVVLRHRLVKYTSILLPVAQFYANQQGMEQVYIWNLNHLLIHGTELESQAQFVTRNDDSLPYISQFKTETPQFKWNLIEYYTWV